MLKFQVRGVKGSVHEHLVEKDSAIFGRGPESDVLLQSNEASRRHARVFIENGMVKVEDLGSTNGTFIRQEKVGFPVEVEENDPIRMGDIFVRVTYVPEKQSDSDEADAGYSMAQRFGNRKETVMFNAKEFRNSLKKKDQE